MMNQDLLLSQLRNNQKSDRSTIYQPHQFPIAWLLLVIASSMVLFFICTGFYGLGMIMVGQEQMIDSSFWPIYTHYPYLALPQVILLFLLPYLVWRVEKHNRDMMLVLFSEGFVLYRPWGDEKKCQAKIVNYTDVQQMKKKIRLTGIALEIFYSEKEREVVFLTTKSNDSLAIREQIVLDYLSFTQRDQLS